jgi:hypothetical protein
VGWLQTKGTAWCYWHAGQRTGKECFVTTEGAGVLHGIGATRTDKFSKRAGQKGEINDAKARCEGAGVLHGVGTTRTDKFNKKSEQKSEINTPKP